MKRKLKPQPAAAKRPAKLLDWGAADVDSDAEGDDDGRKKGAARGVANGGREDGSEEDEAALRETADEKRLRLAQQYLADVEAGVRDDDASEAEGESDDGEVGTAPLDRVGLRLEKARMEASGTLRRDVALSLAGRSIDAASLRWLGGHDLTVTCVALAGDDRAALSGSKDNSVLQWDIETGQRTATLLPRWKRGKGPKAPAVKARAGEVLAVAASSDGRFAAAGGRDKLVKVWDLRSGELLQSFTGHRDAVSGLAFRVGASGALFSCSHDRCVKLWDLGAMGYVETLYGHQAPVNAVAAWRKERAVTGGDDRTLRLWKVAEGSHALFRAPGAGGTDCVAALDEDWFLAGGQDCALTLWMGLKKRPAAVAPEAHGPGRWLTSVAGLPSSDLAATGSSDGQLRLWRVDREKRTLAQVAAAPVPGFVNGLAIASSARFVVAAVGQEHRLGRWKRLAEGRNRVCVVPLLSGEDTSGGGDSDSSGSSSEGGEESGDEDSGSGGEAAIRKRRR